MIISAEQTWPRMNTNEHELKGNMQNASWRFYNQCEFDKSVAGVFRLFGSGNERLESGSVLFQIP